MGDFFNRYKKDDWKRATRFRSGSRSNGEVRSASLPTSRFCLKTYIGKRMWKTCRKQYTYYDIVGGSILAPPYFMERQGAWSPSNLFTRFSLCGCGKFVWWRSTHWATVGWVIRPRRSFTSDLPPAANHYKKKKRCARLGVDEPGACTCCRLINSNFTCSLCCLLNCTK